MLWRYILKRIGQTFIVLFAVSILSFVLIRLAPGNPAMMVLGDSATVEDIAAMEAKLGLDQPLVKQYITYIVGVLHGDLGTSIIYNKAVSSLVISRFFVSLKIVKLYNFFYKFDLLVITFNLIFVTFYKFLVNLYTVSADFATAGE